MALTLEQWENKLIEVNLNIGAYSALCDSLIRYKSLQLLHLHLLHSNCTSIFELRGTVYVSFLRQYLAAMRF